MRWDTPGLNFSLFQTDPDLHTKTKPWTPPFSLSTHTWRREMLTSRKCFRAWTILRSTPSTGPDTLTSCLRQSLTTARRPTLTSTWPWILDCGPGTSTIGFTKYFKKVRWFPNSIHTNLCVSCYESIDQMLLSFSTSCTGQWTLWWAVK